MNRTFMRRWGWMVAVLLSALSILLFFMPVVRSLNTTLFSTTGDGLKSYYCYLYHIQDDPSALRFTGMNYPYGESVFFTDNQPFLSVTMRGLCKIFPGLYNHAVAIWNGSILLSIVLAALFIYLILTELGVGWLIGALAGAGVAMLSPQVGRMASHFSLSYVFVIPMAIWILLRFSKKPAYWLSALMAALMIWSGATHMYYIAFLAMLIFFFWLFFGLGRRETFGKWKVWAPHVFIQLILPVLVIEILTMVSSTANDRGQFPYGFLYYRAYPESVFLPADRPYGSFIQNFISYKHINWEGYAYIGLVATLTTVLFFGGMIVRLIRGRFRTFWMFNGDLFHSFLFWGSFAILLYSFGLPFIAGMENLVDHIGPVRQIRGVGRFAWVFYYSINILAFSVMWRLYRNMNRKWIPVTLLSLAILVLFAEGQWNYRLVYPFMNKKDPVFTDFGNKLPEDQWVGRIDPARYQSILSLPYFHVGSENIWLEPACGMDKESYTVSMKTGLPLQAVMMGRTSISQTYHSLELSMEPYRDPEILNELPSRKPILVVSSPCDQLGAGEKIMLEHTRPLFEAGDFQFGEITPDTLKSLTRKHIQHLFATHDPSARFDGDRFIMPDTTVATTYRNYDWLNDSTGYLGHGVLALNHQAPGTFFRGKPGDISLPARVTFSFWVKNIQVDNMARMEMEIATFNADSVVTSYDVTLWGRKLKQIDGDWGLVEFTIPVAKGESVSLTMFPGKVWQDLIIDDLLIREEGTDIWGYRENGDLVLNDRLYPAGMIR